MKGKQRQRDRTRNAILDALASVIVECGGLGFSIQQVADRAGVTHRTVYNHFPTRDALRDGLEARVEDLLQETGHRPPNVARMSAPMLGSLAGELYADFDACASVVHAQVTFSLAGGGTPTRARRRTAQMKKAIASEVPADAPVSADEAAAAIRVFLSSTGWHLLTAHLGLSPTKAATTATWATQTLLEAAMRRSRQKGRPR